MDSYGHGNEPLSFATGVEFLDQLTHCRLLKKVCFVEFVVAQKMCL